MILSLVAVLLLVAAIIAMTKFSSSQPAAATRNSYASDASFLDNFSPKTYRPMLRLASQMDRNYLNSAHGTKLAVQHRKIQRQLLREYLRDLSRDFNRLYEIATVKSVQAINDSGNLSVNLVEQQMGFIFLIWTIEARLILDSVLPYSVDLKPVIGYIDALASQTRELARPQLAYHVV
jgi:hypothetical protein